ncbi:LINE-1 type transposase domain containing protein 1 [Dissostichus eleginoides]|uniref:LINE-1 type transposase domain containing protein 1 n=1 Tax=Dissostichus eleginoides TaxID=100907 RepID=A0AAD9CRN2_DISEL|nr:LINE-1 type transposase domain containing protein 1 [Dissostichus eleginoides]
MSRKGKKGNTQSKNHNEEEIDQLSQVSNSMDDDTQPDDADPSGEAHITLILKELRDFRKDSSQQLNGIKEDINKINKRMEEAEERIDAAETRINSWEEVVSGLVKLQVQTEAKLTDLEGRTRRENVRIYGVEEGAEAMTTSVIAFVEELLIKGLELPPSTLQIERAHHALGPKPPAEASPRSLVVKCSSFKMKEDLLAFNLDKMGFLKQRN